MKSIFRICRFLLSLSFLTVAAVGCTSGEKIANGNSSLKDQQEKVAYSLGMRIGKDFAREEVDINVNALRQGIEDGLRGAEPRLSEVEIEQARKEFVAGREERRQSLAGKNLVAGEAFLEENAKKEGVRTLPSGLQYRVLAEGNGVQPTPDNNVKAHYVVRGIDGTEYESTRKSGNPAVFPVSGIIPAFTEALPLMQEGAKWELYVPAKLAYGEKGVGNVIGPNQALIFEIEFIAVH